jgi:hypothetical protein
MRWLLVVAALVLLPLALFWLRQAQAPAGLEPLTDSNAPAMAPAPAAVLESNPQVESARQSAPADNAVPAAAPAPLTTATVGLARIVGQLLDGSGAPLASGSVNFAGFPANADRIRKHGNPSNWRDLELFTDTQGRFEIRFDPPPAFQFSLKLTAQRHAGLSWRWSEFEAGQQLDLGSVQLALAGSIRGVLVDAAGQPCRGGWRVSANSAAGYRDERMPVGASTTPDALSGEFRLGDLAPGMWKLSASTALASNVEGPKVEVLAGQESEARLVYSGPALDRTILVRVQTQPYHGFAAPKVEVQLLRGSEPIPAASADPRQASSQQRFENLEPGSYSARVEHPAYLPWREDGIQPGSLVTARLKGNSRVQLKVLDDASGEALSRYELRTRFEKASFSPNEFELLKADAVPPADGLFEGLVPGDQTLLVRAPGYATCEVPLGVVEPSSSAVHVARVQRGVTLRVRVLRADGETPVEGAHVRLESAYMRSGSIMQTDKAPSTTSDAQGWAQLESVARGEYTLHALLAPLLRAEVVVVLNSTDPVQQSELRLPPYGSLSGVIEGADPQALAKAGVELWPAGMQEMELWTEWREAGLAKRAKLLRPDAEGRFEHSAVPAGRHTVKLQLQANEVFGFRGQGAVLVLGEIEVREGETTQARFAMPEQALARVRYSVRSALGWEKGAMADAIAIREGGLGGQPLQTLLDNQGKGLSDFINPGEIEIVLRGPQDEWQWFAPQRYVLAAGQTLDVELDLSIVPGKVRLVGASDGEVLAAVSGTFHLEGSAPQRRLPWRTDQQGILEALLEPGSYTLELYAKPPQKYLPLRIVWPPAAEGTEWKLELVEPR